MKRTTATILTSLALLGVLGSAGVSAQTLVTVRDINALTQTQLDALNAAAGVGMSSTTFNENVLSPLDDQMVQFTAVVLSDPKDSGLSSPNAEGLPSRVHVYVRDTSAVHLGYEGMGTMIVDGAWQANGTLSLAVGDVITVVARVNNFFSTTQIEPTSITLVGPYASVGLPDSIMDPVAATTADFTVDLGGGQIQARWDAIPDFRSQYIELRGATIVARDLTNPDRPLWYVTTDANATVTAAYTTSLQYRNDRNTTYSSELNVHSTTFVPPPPGAKVNLRGFLDFNGSAQDYAGRAVPPGAFLSINPMAASDLEVTETPPEATAPSRPSALVASATDFGVTTTATADPARTLNAVSLTYYTSADATHMTVPATNTTGDTWEAVIPGQPDGTFVIYRAHATDNTGAEFDSGWTEFRVLDAITRISHIQESFLFGESPFVGMTGVSMDITATVQTDPGATNLVSFQDDGDLAPWTGIVARTASRPELVSALQLGDVVHITQADIGQFNSYAQLDHLTFQVTAGGTSLPAKALSTDALADVAVAESLEGMLLRFEDVEVVAPNADAPSGPFGEFSFRSVGASTNFALRADDASRAIEYTGNDPSTVFTAGDHVEFVQGILSYSFGNYKILPGTFDRDIGAINVASEIAELPAGFFLKQNYPNPFNPQTTIRYSLHAATPVRLEAFDLTGRSVGTLVDRVETPGAHEVTFDARGLASGVYLYRLQAGSYAAVRHMTIVK